MHKFEIARLIAARAFQLALNAPPMIKPKEGERFEHLAKRELEAGVIPLEPLKKRRKE